ncbi:hypothetical protein M9H77_26910 [Catharanthus roseus]|uniref:Uncharacterized protein n=1 Tax=Catharanthus roseus TaxID=4058 RepID=A0ACC0ACF1_CATRO|nr:hypothetical protein M9H77_26910 [Catharanthus roseus]
MCGWKRNRGEYVRYHEGYSYGAHNQGGNAYDRINLSGTNFTPRKQDGVGNFSPCARSFEDASYKYYEGNRIEAENGIAYRPSERVPRKETRNEKDYVNIDERFHTKGNISCGKSSQSLNKLLDCAIITLSPCLLYEDDKAILASCPSLLRFRNTHLLIEGGKEWGSIYGVNGALSDKFRVGQFQRLECSQAMGNSKARQEMYIFSEGIEKEESVKPSLLEKSSLVNELLDVRIEIDESVEMHVEGEMSKEDFGYFMSDMSFEEEESIEFEKIDRVEKKERLVEKSSFFVSISSLAEKCEKDESSKEEENDLEEMREQKRRVKKNKRIQKKRWIILESQIYFKEIKFFSLVFIEHGEHFIFPNSLGTYLERRYFIEFNSLSCATPRVYENDFNVANCFSCVLGVEDGRSMGKELGPILEDLSMSLSLNPSSLCYEVSLEELKSLLDSYNFQVILIGYMCIIAFEGNLFLLGLSITICHSSNFSLEDLLMSSSVVLDLLVMALEFSPTCLHHNINEKKETYHGVLRPRQKCWRKTNLMLWRFDNEFFFKAISLLSCVFFQKG